jgi:pimeloyl-ACP methyl ester carboxylesterase
MSSRVDVAVAGGGLATYRLGAEDAGVPLVLAIHGITSSSRTWLATARALGDRAALIAVDLRGRARSSALPGPFGIDVHVRDLLAVLDRFGLQRPVVAGHSLGAYIAARLAVRHPDRVGGLVLVDGGLPIPESRGVDPERFLLEFLGPSVARLQMTFPDPAAYRAWWAAHPAFAGSDIDESVLDEYASHDLAGHEPNLRSSVNPQVIRDDGLDLFDPRDAEALSLPAVLLCAPRGMVDDPKPMQPLALARRWAAEDPMRRRALGVPDVNHYTIVLGRAGAEVVAEEIATATAAPEAAPVRPSR